MTVSGTYRPPKRPKRDRSSPSGARVPHAPQATRRRDGRDERRARARGPCVPAPIPPRSTRPPAPAASGPPPRPRSRRAAPRRGRTAARAAASSSSDQSKATPVPPFLPGHRRVQHHQVGRARPRPLQRLRAVHADALDHRQTARLAGLGRVGAAVDLEVGEADDPRGGGHLRRASRPRTRPRARRVRGNAGQHRGGRRDVHPARAARGEHHPDPPDAQRGAGRGLGGDRQAAHLHRRSGALRPHPRAPRGRPLPARQEHRDDRPLARRAPDVERARRGSGPGRACRTGRSAPAACPGRRRWTASGSKPEPSSVTSSVTPPSSSIARTRHLGRVAVALGVGERLLEDPVERDPLRDRDPVHRELALEPPASPGSPRAPRRPRSRPRGCPSAGGPRTGRGAGGR